MSQGYLFTRAIVRVLFWLSLIALALLMTGGDFR